METRFLKPRSRCCVYLILGVFMVLAMVSEGRATLTSHFVTGAHWLSPGAPSGYFGNHWLNDIYIDPSNTNWIAWHDNTTPDIISGQEFVGDYNNWLGIDDYMYVTITGPSGSSGRMQMDYNNSIGSASGTQAVFYGTAAAAPDVRRAQGTSYPPPQGNIDEAGLFNSFFDASGAGVYTFHFEFYNAYYGSLGNPDFYVLIDDQSASVPEPATMLLLGAGMAGFVGSRIRRSRK